MSRALAAAQAEAQNADRSVSPLVLLGQASDVIRAEGAEPDLIAFTALDGLEIELRLTDFAAVDQLVAALANAGIDTDLRDALHDKRRRWRRCGRRPCRLAPDPDAGRAAGWLTG